MNNSREYGGEVSAMPLVEWLNQARTTRSGAASYHRVREIHALLTELQQLSDDYLPAYKDSHLASRPHYQKLFREGHTLGDRLNSLLSKYRLQPVLREIRLGARRWFLGWRTRSGRAFSATLRHELLPFDISFSEPDAIMRCIELSQEGFLSRVRACAECSKWFYARFSHGRFCTTKCQQAHYRSDPDFLEYRRQYQRKNRQLKKQHGRLKR